MADLSTNVLGQDVEIIGEVRFTSDLIVDGKVKGKIVTRGSLTIGENAQIEGEVEAGKMNIFGVVEGNLKSTDHCTLHPNCSVEGDIEAASMSMTEGASFSGRSVIGKKAAGGPSKPASPPSAS